MATNQGSKEPSKGTGGGASKGGESKEAAKLRELIVRVIDERISERPEDIGRLLRVAQVVL